MPNTGSSPALLPSAADMGPMELILVEAADGALLVVPLEGTLSLRLARVETELRAEARDDECLLFSLAPGVLALEEEEEMSESGRERPRTVASDMRLRREGSRGPSASGWVMTVVLLGDGLVECLNGNLRVSISVMVATGGCSSRTTHA